MTNTLTRNLKATGAALVLAASLATLPPVAQADQTRIPVMSQQSERATMELPRHGQTRSAVQARFGEPQGIKGPVGEPPILQWFYPEFVVYFEGDRVIHTVVRYNEQ